MCCNSAYKNLFMEQWIHKSKTFHTILSQTRAVLHGVWSFTQFVYKLSSSSENAFCQLQATEVGAFTEAGGLQNTVHFNT